MPGPYGSVREDGRREKSLAAVGQAIALCGLPTHRNHAATVTRSAWAGGPKGCNVARDGIRDPLPGLFARPAGRNASGQVGNVRAEAGPVFGWLDDHQILVHFSKSSLVNPACFRILPTSQCG